MLDRLFSQETMLFTIPALVGTGVFLLRMSLMALGGFGADVDADADIDVDVDADVDTDSDGSDSTDAFKLLSIQSIAAFLMGFGWGGASGIIGLDWGLGLSLLLGVGFGVALMWMLGLLMKAVYALQSSGNIRISDAIGLQGTVYAQIPAKGQGKGKVRLVIENRARMYYAASDGELISTNTAVRVTRINDDNTLTVTSAT